MNQESGVRTERAGVRSQNEKKREQEPFESRFVWQKAALSVLSVHL